MTEPEPLPQQANQGHGPAAQPLMGMAVLMTMACSGVSLTNLANQLIERIKRDPSDANALMDLSIISHLWFKHDIGLATQAQALRLTRHYRLPARGAATLRLLALMQHGDLAANTPLEFLVQDSDIALDLLFLDPYAPFPDSLPEHDLLFVAVGESAGSHSLLQKIAAAAAKFPAPFINHPERIARLSRGNVSTMLASLPGIEIPATVQVTRAQLNRADPLALLPDGEFPLIIRPLDSHAGQGLEKIDNVAALELYLREREESDYFLSRFIDYRNADGLYRKYRIVIVDGWAYAGHMALSSHWMIHYLNAQMSDSAQKREEEAAFMAQFDSDFGLRHRAALDGIARTAGLDYLVIDCAESATGKLLVFEIDSAAVIHAMDSAEVFPYKQAQAQKIFDAFRVFLHSTIEKNATNRAK
ncbi:MAG TPA: RimK family alpha-L-glutamate ligase [Burkholderiaceae bacterium]